MAHMFAAPVITEEAIRMNSEESRRKLCELQLDCMVDALDDQENSLNTF